MQKFNLVDLNYHDFEKWCLCWPPDCWATLACFDSSTKKNIDNLFLEKLSSIKRLSTETLMKELDRALKEKNEFQHSAMSKFKIKSIEEHFREKIVEKIVNLKTVLDFEQENFGTRA